MRRRGHTGLERSRSFDSPKSKRKIERLQFDVAKERIAQQAKVKTTMTALRQLQRSESPEKTALEKKINELATLQA